MLPPRPIPLGQGSQPSLARWTAKVSIPAAMTSPPMAALMRQILRAPGLPDMAMPLADVPYQAESAVWSFPQVRPDFGHVLDLILLASR
jgi:hypothetical protein